MGPVCRIMASWAIFKGFGQISTYSWSPGIRSLIPVDYSNHLRNTKSENSTLTVRIFGILPRKRNYCDFLCSSQAVSSSLCKLKVGCLHVIPSYLGHLLLDKGIKHKDSRKLSPELQQVFLLSSRLLHYSPEYGPLNRFNE